MRRIDMHTHVFNVRYLPIAGILHQLGGVPVFIARGIAQLLNARTADRIGHTQEEPKDLLLAAMDALVTEPATALAASTPPELIDDPVVRAALTELAAQTGELQGLALAGHVDNATAQAQFERLYARAHSVTVDGIFERLGEYLNWLKFLTHSEQFIVDRLVQTYGDDVEMFVHHMMDMEHFYEPGDCRYDFVAEQIDRMRRLVDANEGRLLTFVAWSPKRPNGLSVVRRAIDDGIAAGVKVYPPSGYQADDPRNDALFDFAAERDVPLFTHCTPVGFESQKGFGVKSDPRFWRSVLHRSDKAWKNLRVCLGHAGGDKPWFGVEPFAGSFAERAVQLASDPETPNVYLEFGYHDDILDPTKREHFASLLAQKIEESDGRLGDRIVYGTDWHIIEHLPRHGDYFKAFAEVFAKPPLDSFADRFFFRNAGTFLNLETFAQRRPPGDPVRERVMRILDDATGDLENV